MGMRENSRWMIGSIFMVLSLSVFMLGGCKPGQVDIVHSCSTSRNCENGFACSRDESCLPVAAQGRIEILSTSVDSASDEIAVGKIAMKQRI